MGEIRVVIPDMLERHLEGLVKTGGFSSKAELARAAIVSMSKELSTTFGSYDQANILSPDGRIFQMEYAEAAMSRGAPVIAMSCRDGLLMVSGHPKVPSRLLERKVEKLSGRIAIGTAGIIVDTIVLLRRARRAIEEARDQGIDPDSEQGFDYLLEELGLLVYEKCSSLQHRPLAAGCIVGWSNGSNSKIFLVSGSGAFYRQEGFCGIGGLLSELSPALKEISETNPTINEAKERIAEQMDASIENMVVCTISEGVKAGRKGP